MSYFEDEDTKPVQLKKARKKQRMHARQVMIDNDRAEHAFSIGEDNFSEGVRRCIDFYIQSHKVK